MEALALLCTLHADGPASLRRLRRAGCASIQQLETLASAELASILDVPPAVARRLGREARGLSTRLDLGSFDDQEEAPEIGSSTLSPDAPPVPGDPPAAGGLARRDRALLERVMGQWDQAPRPQEPAVPANPPLVLDELPEEPPQDASALAETVEARPINEAREAELVDEVEALVGGEVDGLDADLAAALNTAGITDLFQLVEADAVEVARQVRRPFAQVRRVQFLARRELEVNPPATPELVIEPEVIEHAPLPRPATELELPVPRALGAPAPVQEPAPLQGPVQPVVEDEPGAPASATRGTKPRKFWEPRPQWAGDLGIKIPVEEPIPLPPEPPTLPATPRVRRPKRPGRTLNWTFEVPTPTRVSPRAEPGSTGPLGVSGGAMAPISPPPPRSDEAEGSAGPFA